MTFSKKLFDLAGSSKLLILYSGSVHPYVIHLVVYLVHVHSQIELHKTFSASHYLLSLTKLKTVKVKKVATACPGRRNVIDPSPEANNGAM